MDETEESRKTRRLHSFFFEETGMNHELISYLLQASASSSSSSSSSPSLTLSKDDWFPPPRPLTNWEWLASPRPPFVLQVAPSAAASPPHPWCLRVPSPTPPLSSPSSSLLPLPSISYSITSRLLLRSPGALLLPRALPFRRFLQSAPLALGLLTPSPSPSLFFFSSSLPPLPCDDLMSVPVHLISCFSLFSHLLIKTYEWTGRCLHHRYYYYFRMIIITQHKPVLRSCSICSESHWVPRWTSLLSV